MRLALASRSVLGHSGPMADPRRRTSTRLFLASWGFLSLAAVTMFYGVDGSSLAYVSVASASLAMALAVGAVLRPADPPRAVGERVAPNKVLTLPNLLSFVRILLIPVFVLLLLDEGTRMGGFLLLGAVVSTDWVDGAIARRTGQVTELGKVLDPLADRLAMGAALITFVVTGIFPLWAALLILVRDAVVLGAAAIIGATGGPRIDVRPMGKYGTFTLMWAIPLIAWGNAGLPFDDLFLVVGWVFFPVGTFEYYLATVMYVQDLRRAYRERETV